MTDSPRRIAFCITELDPGGAERALARIATRLNRTEWMPQVYCLSGRGDVADVLEAAEIPVHCLHATSRWDASLVGRLRAQLNEFRPEILQTFLFHANIAGRLAARKTEIPIVVSGVRVAEQDARWRMRIDRWTNRFVTHNVCVSRAIADEYLRLGVPRQKLSVIPNGVDAAAIESAAPADLTGLGMPPAAQVLLAIGRLHRQKGFDLLIDAAGPLLESHPDLHLLIVGDGPQRSLLEQQIAGSQHAARIHLVGRRDDVPALLRSATVFVLSSRWEGMPNVVLEALVAGVPVVATDVEGVRDIIEDGTSGIIVEPQSPAALTAGLRKVLSDETLARNLAAAGRERVRSRFTWPQVVDQYTALWNRLLLEGT